MADDVPDLKPDKGHEAGPESLGTTPQHRRFTLLTLLLRLVLVAYGGNAELASKPTQAIEDDNPDNDIWFEPLDALAAILVQRDEVIATTYLSKCLTVIHSEDSNLPGTELELPVSSTQLPECDLKEPSIYPLNIAAVANPDTKRDPKPAKKSHASSAKRQVGPRGNVPDGQANQDTIPPADSHEVKASDQGKNLWPQVLEDPLRFAFEGSRPLRDHAMTLASYLNAYRKAEKNIQATYSRAFFQYILTTCWPKMYRRITTWTAVGFIFRLNALVDGFDHKVQESWGEVTDPALGPGDRSLRQLLRQLDGVQVVHSIMRSGSYTFQSPENLMAAIWGSGAIYKKETALEFHVLVCSTFINYAMALARVKKDYDAWTKGNSGMDPKALRNTFVTLETFTRLLLSILSSRSFKSHIQFLLSSFTLSSLLPPDKFIDQYKAFAERNQLDLNEVAKGGALGPQGRNEYDADSDMEKVESCETPSGLLSWLRSFVIHFLGKRALERHCVRVKDERLGFVQFRILTVGRSIYGVQSPAWSEFEAIIRETLGRDESSANAIITQLSDFISKNTPNRGEKGRTVATFQKILSADVTSESLKGIQWPGPHCEAIAAALHNIDSVPTDGNDVLLSVCQTMEHNVIGVSKLCCPACWELLRILKDNYDKQFTVRGFHTTVYPVQLPSWLPEGIVDEMVVRFKFHLRIALSLLAESKSMEAVRRNPGHRTRESQSNISVASTTMDEPAQKGPSEAATKFKQALGEFLARQEMSP